MSVASEYHKIPVVNIQPEVRLATTAELNLAPSLVTGCDGAMRMRHWAATHLKSGSVVIGFITSTRRRWL
ncbi:hypothetical protein C5S36_00720 [Candidatus Methanophagaceae archaeon]|nr:hypothetical protein C5S36_00720 [Methanophagales archaeon]